MGWITRHFVKLSVPVVPLLNFAYQVSLPKKKSARINFAMMSLYNVWGYSWCEFGKTNFMPSIFILGINFYTCTNVFFLFNKAQPIIHLFCGFCVQPFDFRTLPVPNEKSKLHHCCRPCFLAMFYNCRKSFKPIHPSVCNWLKCGRTRWGWFHKRHDLGNHISFRYNTYIVTFSKRYNAQFLFLPWKRKVIRESVDE